MPGLAPALISSVPRLSSGPNSSYNLAVTQATSGTSRLGYMAEMLVEKWMRFLMSVILFTSSMAWHISSVLRHVDLTFLSITISVTALRIPASICDSSAYLASSAPHTGGPWMSQRGHASTRWWPSASPGARVCETTPKRRIRHGPTGRCVYSESSPSHFLPQSLLIWRCRLATYSTGSSSSGRDPLLAK